MNQRPLRNGRFLSPDSERGLKEKVQGIYSLAVVNLISAHFDKHTDGAPIVDHKYQ